MVFVETIEGWLINLQHITCIRRDTSGNVEALVRVEKGGWGSEQCAMDKQSWKTLATSNGRLKMLTPFDLWVRNI